MSTERHGSKYKPKHRSKRLNKVRRPKRGANTGSRFDKKLIRAAKLKRKWKAKKEIKRMVTGKPPMPSGYCSRCRDHTTWEWHPEPGEWLSACCSYPELDIEDFVSDELIERRDGEDFQNPEPGE